MIFEVMKLLWPFLKEFFLGKGGTIGQTVKRREWKKLGMLFLVTFSLIVNFFLLPKSVILSDEVMKLQHEIKKLKTETPQQPDPSQPEQHTDEVVPAPKPPDQPQASASEAVTGPPPSESDDYRRRLDTIMSRAQQLDRPR